jgi:hypothetical protein
MIALIRPGLRAAFAFGGLAAPQTPPWWPDTGRPPVPAWSRMRMQPAFANARFYLPGRPR